MSTLNHLKKNESLDDKQLVVINSDSRDLLEQGTTSFTYTFDQPIERVSKIDIMYCKIPRSYYNVNNDNTNMSITTETFTETITTDLVVDDEDISNDVIQATNVVDGTVIRTNIFSSIGDVNILNVVTHNTFVYVAGNYANGILELRNFNESIETKALLNVGLRDLYVAKYTLNQEIIWRFKLAGVLDDVDIDMSVTDTDLFITGMFTSFPMNFYSINDRLVGKIVSDGNISSFVCRYTTDGIPNWCFKILGIADLTRPTKVAYDEVNQKIYVTGTYNRDLEIYDINDNPTPIATKSLAAGETTNVFVSQVNIDGTVNWTATIKGDCTVRSSIINPTNNNIIIGVEYKKDLEPLNQNDTPGAISRLKGSQNMAILEYDQTGTYIVGTQIGGSNIESNIQMDARESTLVVSGIYSSNPLTFNNAYLNGTPNILNINGLSNNIFITKYTLSNDMPGNKTVVWSTNIYDESNEISNVSISLSNLLEIAVAGNYTTLLKFNDVEGYQLGQDLINTTGVNYAFVCKYATNGVFQQRSYIEAPLGGVAVANDIDAHSNNILLAMTYMSSITLFNSNNLQGATIDANGTTRNGLLVSYVNNINNYIINTKTLGKRIICRTLTGIDLNYTLNLNALSQQMGIKTSEKFRPMIFGSSITWDTVDITSSNNKLSLVFKIGDKKTLRFNEYAITFVITEATGYNPFNLAFELSKVIKKTITGNTNINNLYTDNSCIYDSDKKIFYLIFEINGTVKVHDPLSGLAMSSIMNLPLTVSQHCVIAEIPISETPKITVNDKSRLSIKLNEEITNTISNNSDFGTAFANVSSNSGSLIITSIDNKKISATANSTTDNISSDLQLKDEITFDSPWKRTDPNESTFIDALKYRDIDISSDGQYKTAVVEDGNIYVSSNYGRTWVPKETRRNWVKISMTSSGEIQAACAAGSQIFISNNFGETWAPRDSNRNWQSISISRSTGTFQTAVVAGGFIYSSSDTGASWVIRGTPRNYVDVDMSSDGIKQTAIVFGGGIYTSSDGGLIWNEISPTIINEWRGIVVDSSGLRQWAINSFGEVYKTDDAWNTAPTVTMVASGKGLNAISVAKNNPSELVIIGNVGDLYQSSSGGNSWTPNGFRESWSGIAISDTGTNRAAIVFEGGIYNSTDTGTTWIDIKSVKPWMGVAMTSDGVLQIAGEHNGYIHRSTDSGNTWNRSNSPLKNWTYVSTSSDGKYMFAFSSGNVYRSLDQGLNWSNRGYLGTITGVDTSATGKYQVIVTENGTTPKISTNYGASYSSLTNVETSILCRTTLTTIPTVNTVRVSFTSGETDETSSLSGQKINITGGTGFDSVIPANNEYTILNPDFETPYNSSTPLITITTTWNGNTPDATTTFEILSKVRRWQGAGISSDGSHMTIGVIDGTLMTTTDYGVSWTQHRPSTLEEGEPEFGSHRGVTMSSTGQYQFLVGWGSRTFKSSDFGKTWSVTTLPIGNRLSAIMSSDGSSIMTQQYGGVIEISDDFGVTWSNRESTRLWSFSAMSADGTKMAATDENYIYESIDSGITWSRKLLVQSNPYESVLWDSSAISDDGKYIMTVGRGYSINLSNNYGITFRKDVTDYRDWRSVSISSTGRYQSVISHTGEVITSQDYGETWARPTGGNDNIYGNAIIVSDNGLIQMFTGGFGTNVSRQIYESIDGGTNFSVMSSSPLLKWRCLTMTGDAVYRFASAEDNRFFRYGQDIGSGDEWEELTVGVPASIITIACSDNNAGTVKVVVGGIGGRLHLSSDNGNTFIEVGPTLTASNSWQSIRISGDGNTHVAAAGSRFKPCDTNVTNSGNYIYYSTDNWVNFEKVNSQRPWSSMDMTKDGSQLIATECQGHLYQSFDRGLTWGIQQNNMQPVGIALTSDGINQTAISNGRGIYRSTTSGNTWDFVPVVNNWRDVAVSLTTGQHQIAIPYNGQIYYSSDTGQTWVQQGPVKDWRGVAISQDGNIRVAVALNDNIWMSTAFGAWTIIANAGTRDWESVDISADGSVHTAVVKGGKIYVSTDTGVTYNEKEIDRNWKDIALSKVGAQGLRQTAVVYGGKIYYSLDTGSTWTEVDSDRNWQSVTLVGDGTNQTAVVFGGSIYKSTNSGVTWEPKDVPRNWWSVATSHDPVTESSVVYDDEIYKSPDLGDTWNIQFGLVEIASVALSSDGTIQVAAVTGGQIEFSNNSGLTWETHELVRNWRQISMTSDASKLTAIVYNGNIYTATSNGGVLSTWTEVVNTMSWQSVAMSSDGTIRSAVPNGGRIQISMDDGVTWNPVGPPAADWSSITISSQFPTFQAATVRGGKIFYTTDSWNTWSEVEENRNWQDISISSNGTILTALVQGGQIYTSTDSGTNWTPRDSNRNWLKVDMTSDGTQQIAIVNGGFIYTSINTGVTWTPIENSREWRGVAINDSGDIQIANDRKKILLHKFGLEQKIVLNVESIESDSSINDTVYFNQVARLTGDPDYTPLNNIDMSDMSNYTIIRKEPSSLVDIFIPPANYTPETLVDAINAEILSVNPAYVNPFEYNSATRKISFTPRFDGEVLGLTELLQKMGFSAIPNPAIVNETITARGVINPEISGPLNLYIKSDIIGGAKKHQTAFSTNKKLKNLIAPLEINEDTNTFRIPNVVEVFLSKKESMKTVDIQIVDEQGDIVNLNGGVVQVIAYFISS